jgi:hypothetical protein
MFYGLTPLGIVHTIISLVAVGAGLIALVRDKEIRLATRTGQVYVITAPQFRSFACARAVNAERWTGFG